MTSAEPDLKAVTDRLEQVEKTLRRMRRTRFILYAVIFATVLTVRTLRIPRTIDAREVRFYNGDGQVCAVVNSGQNHAFEIELLSPEGKRRAGLDITTEPEPRVHLTAADHETIWSTQETADSLAAPSLTTK
jgi:hypothetical protein